MADVKQFIFFDFEMLCSKQGMSFASMESIRLGAVKYDVETKVISTFDRYIKPKQTEPISEFCKNLTKIEDHHLENADHFPVVLQAFLSWVGSQNEARFFSWSSNDLTRLELDASSHDIPQRTISNIKNNYIDFQEIFTKRVSKTNLSVENALALYGLSFQGEKHNPMFDAYNTMRIYHAFCEDLEKSDLIMLKRFIFENIKIDLNSNINLQLKYFIKRDLQDLFKEISIISNIRYARKLVKRTSKLVKKYENILLNRSKLFNEEIILYVQLLVQFYHDLVHSYNKHFSYGCKIIILHEHMTSPLQHLTA
ncbi:3'-5' exonuclease [Anaerobacillus isosaccharinicus]|uniref:Exonuclease n=1 Tax=Anaerobacillus isosaccharinicus TaxID=1532552 RepID=A0A1S2L5B4_9BACI|nr:3'-5' exonuclease [Anaerobacillus isosaccharinicus]MBA5586945.1 exonuclease domain-containing protein [Anaerobacillus isosaccharinicus]QOY34850.1 exonuclease domain-containing protein [Anaerobacillus isosaccharinicus]